MTIARPQGQDSPEVAAAVTAIENYWGEMAQRWPWMRQPSLRPIYVLSGEMLIALTRAFPATIHSNQARWYAREINQLPTIYVLPPAEFQEDARRYSGRNDAKLLEGKQAVTLIYLAKVGGVEQVAKTLLISTASTMPMFRAQVAHELLNCACASDWSNQQMRSGIRLAHWKSGAPLQRGGLLNDLLIDALLLDFLPTATTYTRGDLLEGQQGPYWRIAEALGSRIATDVITNALFGPDADRLVFEGHLNEAFERGDASLWLDQLIAARDWAQIADAVGAHLAN